MLILQTCTFARHLKKLHPNQKQDLDKAIKHMAKHPLEYNLKKANLSGVRVYKFRLVKQPALLAYLLNEKNDNITLLALGFHENFYRDLSRS